MKKITSLTTAVCLSLGTLVTGAAAANAALPDPQVIEATTSDNEALVNGWYVDFLTRDLGSANDPGAQYWVDKLDRGESRTAVLSELVKTKEFATTQTEIAYQYYLGRSANSDLGSRYWSDGIQNDMAVEWVIQNILASSEFQQDTMSDEYFVQFLYYDVVGRDEPSQGEVNYWVNRLKQLNGDRLRLVREMWYAPESVENRIQGHYFFLLERDAQPSAGEVNYWREPEIRSDLKTQVAFAITPEYLAQAKPSNEVR